MRRNPVHDDADAMNVALIDEEAEIVGIAETAGGGVPAGHLIAPGAIKGMLRDWQQFNVGKSQLLNIRNQLICQFSIGKESRFRFEF